MNDANFRMSSWERTEFESCDLGGVDFYSASLPASRFDGCTLTGARLSKSTLTGSRFERSSLEGLQGAGSLRGVTISSDQVLPVALALFAELAIVVE